MDAWSIECHSRVRFAVWFVWFEAWEKGRLLSQRRCPAHCPLGTMLPRSLCGKPARPPSASPLSCYLGRRTLDSSMDSIILHKSFIYFRIALDAQRSCDSSTEFPFAPQPVSSLLVSFISTVHLSQLMNQFCSDTTN